LGRCYRGRKGVRFLYEALRTATRQFDSGRYAHNHHVAANVSEHQAIGGDGYVAANLSVAYEFRSGSEINVVADAATSV
jgi:hypothetical protein